VRVTAGFLKNKLPHVLAVFAFIITAALVMTGGLTLSSYSISPGDYAPRSFFAPHDLENAYATQTVRDRAADIEPVYVMDDAVRRRTINDIERLLRNSDAAGNVEFVRIVTEFSTEIINAGLRNYTDVENVFEELNAKFTVIFRSPQVVAAAMQVVETALRPNMQRDVEQEALLREEAVYAVETVYVTAGQLIVADGEVVDYEAYFLLNEFGFINNVPQRVFILGGLFVLSALSVAVMAAYIWLHHKDILHGNKKLLLLFTIYCLTMVLSWSMNSLAYYFTPLILFAVLAALLLDTKLSIVVTVTATLVCSLIYGGGYEFTVYFLVMGIVVCLFAKYMAERSRMFKIALLFALVSAVTVTALHFINMQPLFDLPLDLLFAVGVPVIIVIFAVGSLPFWEAAFGITTAHKLLELISPDKPLVRKLAAEAPGTYHHSLIVSNLAETAALGVGANHVLARVGGIFHDIGKLRRPGYFSENIIGKNPHDTMEPAVSAEIIIEHVEAGLRLAEQHKLPPVILEFIEQHHGSTLVGYFYAKAKKQGMDAKEAAFKYPHMVPASREVAIVMLADVCEAAVRSIANDGKSYEETRDFVRMLIRKKQEENQLSESGLSIRDLEIIADVFMSVFKGMYHDRVKYDKAGETAPMQTLNAIKQTAAAAHEAKPATANAPVAAAHAEPAPPKLHRQNDEEDVSPEV